VQPPPAPGRCLPLPRRCAPGEPASDDCLPACEFRPTVGPLHAVTKWHWGPDNAVAHPDHVDVWSTPMVARVTDSNCDGAVDTLDPPNIVFVAGNAKGTCCQCENKLVPSNCQKGVLRVLDGASGKEIWSLDRASPESAGFAGLSLALGDLTGDGALEIAALTGEGYVVIIDRQGRVLQTSDLPAVDKVTRGFGWGSGLAIADMEGDGAPEIAWGAAVFTTADGTLTRRFIGQGGSGGGLSTFVDLDGDGRLELLAGRAAFRADGSALWQRADLPDGFPAVGDFDLDGRPEAVLVGKGQLWVLDGATGATRAGPLTLPGEDNGGPPTVADFDGAPDGRPEIGVAMARYYSVTRVDFAGRGLVTRWKQVNHDFSSSVTGSTVFDFEGDGAAEVIYNDECFLWVYDGKSGAVRFATPTTSFTANEASMVADVDGDGRAEMVMVANGASPTGWQCDKAPWNTPDVDLNRPAWAPPPGKAAHRGLTVWGDRANSWVGTRPLWNQHSYHVSNICDGRDDACPASSNRPGAIPAGELANWTVPWLNNFRQNVQGEGIFDAPDATVSLRVSCEEPMRLHAALRNLGLALLPAGVEVGLFVREPEGDRELARLTTDRPLYPGQVAAMDYVPRPDDEVDRSMAFIAKVLVDEATRHFNECRVDNNESSLVEAPCLVR
jgi:hypothetical protein